MGGQKKTERERDRELGAGVLSGSPHAPYVAWYHVLPGSGRGGYQKILGSPNDYGQVVDTVARGVRMELDYYNEVGQFSPQKRPQKRSPTNSIAMKRRWVGSPHRSVDAWTFPKW